MRGVSRSLRTANHRFVRQDERVVRQDERVVRRTNESYAGRTSRAPNRVARAGVTVARRMGRGTGAFGESTRDAERSPSVAGHLIAPLVRAPSLENRAMRASDAALRARNERFFASCEADLPWDERRERRHERSCRGTRDSSHRPRHLVTGMSSRVTGRGPSGAVRASSPSDRTPGTPDTSIVQLSRTPLTRDDESLARTR